MKEIADKEALSYRIGDLSQGREDYIRDCILIELGCPRSSRVTPRGKERERRKE